MALAKHLAWVESQSVWIKLDTDTQQVFGYVTVFSQFFIFQLSSLVR